MSDERVTYDLLIIFTTGATKIITDVYEYRYNNEMEIFEFFKHGYRGFLPKENIVYFGRRFDYEESE